LTTNNRSSKSIVAIEQKAGKSSVNKIKRIEFTTFEGCEPCKDAMRDLRPILQKYNIPLVFKEPEFDGPPGTEILITVPITCLVKEHGEPTCIIGWDSGYAKDVEKNIVESLS
jgi:hypothetical protein